MLNMLSDLYIKDDLMQENKNEKFATDDFKLSAGWGENLIPKNVGSGASTAEGVAVSGIGGIAGAAGIMGMKSKFGKQKEEQGDLVCSACGQQLDKDSSYYVNIGKLSGETEEAPTTKSKLCAECYSALTDDINAFMQKQKSSNTAPPANK
jgi:hypothetical protein